MNTRSRSLLKWELRWISVEIAMVAFGLYIQLGLQLPEAGAFVLFSALAVCGAVRLTHYCRAAQP
jgi:hypothetical protein